jgi:hypothetical protein
MAEKTRPVAPAARNSNWPQYNTANEAGKALIPPAGAAGAHQGVQNALPGAGLSC